MEITKSLAIREPHGTAIEALRMYGPICKQSNLHSLGNIVFLCYLFPVIRGILVHDDTTILCWPARLLFLPVFTSDR